MSLALQRFESFGGIGRSVLSTQINQWLALNTSISLVSASIVHREEQENASGEFTVSLLYRTSATAGGVRYYVAEFFSTMGTNAAQAITSFFATNPLFFPEVILDATPLEVRAKHTMRLLVIYSQKLGNGDVAAGGKSYAAIAVSASGDADRINALLASYEVASVRNIGNGSWPAGGRAMIFQSRDTGGWAGIAPTCYAGAAPPLTTTTTAPSVNVQSCCGTSPNPFNPVTTGPVPVTTWPGTTTTAGPQYLYTKNTCYNNAWILVNSDCVNAAGPDSCDGTNFVAYTVNGCVGGVQVVGNPAPTCAASCPTTTTPPIPTTTTTTPAPVTTTTTSTTTTPCPCGASYVTQENWQWVPGFGSAGCGFGPPGFWAPAGFSCVLSCTPSCVAQTSAVTCSGPCSCGCIPAGGAPCPPC